ncbi:MAG: hypothetical protein HY931_00675 [Candidatus Falkowbacteria bacterium]|nr:MAG: hypothetical protein HY931_00675 [Candidatus Falkowbacteria bacterium]
MDTTSLLVAILVLLLLLSPLKALNNLKLIGVPKWAQKLKASDPWRIGATELFAHAKFVKWLLLAILKTGLLALSCFAALAKIAFAAALSLAPKAVKK